MDEKGFLTKITYLDLVKWKLIKTLNKFFMIRMQLNLKMDEKYVDNRL